jgi:pimeloyl-ACP methyl ester carboxylesterase
VIGPAVAAGYRQIWLAGISLGAFNALHYAAAHSDQLAGIHLIAPYPGTGDILAEISRTGGPHAWAQTEPTEQNDERTWWRWLCLQSSTRQWPTPVYLSTGNADRFLRGQLMLAELIPETHVHFAPGGHDWSTWKALWLTWLDNGPLSQLSYQTSGNA